MNYQICKPCIQNNLKLDFTFFYNYLHMHSEIIFDVETKKLFSDIEGNDPGDLGVSIVSLYKRKVDKGQKETEGKLLSFWEEDFDDMWSIFNSADRIIGFNSLGFDVPALLPYAPPEFAKLKHFDIMDEVKKEFGRRISLDDIAKETLGSVKTDIGINAVKYWEAGDQQSLTKLQKYCEADVLITRDVYDFAVREKNLKFKDKWNTLREVKLDFSYPVEEASANGQAGLF